MAKIVGEYVKKWKVDSIITFDEGGVSGHINHRAVGAGVRYRPSVSCSLRFTLHFHLRILPF